MIDISLYEKYLEQEADGRYFAKEDAPDQVIEDLQKIDREYYEIYKEHLVHFKK